MCPSRSAPEQVDVVTGQPLPPGQSLESLRPVGSQVSVNLLVPHVHQPVPREIALIVVLGHISVSLPLDETLQGSEGPVEALLPRSGKQHGEPGNVSPGIDGDSPFGKYAFRESAIVETSQRWTEIHPSPRSSRFAPTWRSFSTSSGPSGINGGSIGGEVLNGGSTLIQTWR